MVEPEGLLDPLDRALAALESGASLESVLAADPAQAAALRPLLVAALTAGAGPQLPRVPAGAQYTHRTQFLAAAADLRAADAHIVAAPMPARSGWLRLRTWLAGWAGAGSSLLARTVAVSLVLLAGLSAGGYGVVAASDQSLPGDPLYSVKRTVESTQLLLASDQQTRARLQTEFDDRRVREARTVANEGRQVSVDFTGTLISMDGPQVRHWLVSGVAVLVDSQVPIDGVPVVGAQVHIQGTVQNVGEVQAQHVTVLTRAADSAEASPTPSSTVPPADRPTATPSQTPTGVTVTETAEPTQAGPKATDEPVATATNPPVPAATFTPTATEDHGGGPGPTASPTPHPTDGGGDQGGTPTLTPKPTESGDDGGQASPTPRPTDSSGGGGPSPSNTPRPTDDGGAERGGSSLTQTPTPNDSRLALMIGMQVASRQ